MLHEVRQLRKMGQAGDLPRDLVSGLLTKGSVDMALPDQLKKKKKNARREYKFLKTSTFNFSWVSTLYWVGRGEQQRIF